MLAQFHHRATNKLERSRGLPDTSVFEGSGYATSEQACQSVGRIDLSAPLGVGTAVSIGSLLIFAIPTACQLPRAFAMRLLPGFDRSSRRISILLSILFRTCFLGTRVFRVTFSVLLASLGLKLRILLPKFTPSLYSFGLTAFPRSSTALDEFGNVSNLGHDSDTCCEGRTKAESAAWILFPEAC